MTPPSQIIVAPQAQPVDPASLVDFFTETEGRAAETAAKRHEIILNKLAKITLTFEPPLPNQHTIPPIQLIAAST